LDSSYKKFLIISQLSIENIEEKRALIFNSLNSPLGVGGIKTSHSGFVYCRYFCTKRKGRWQTGIDAL